METRLYKNKYYVVYDYPGISGFKRWDKKEIYIVSGHTAQTRYRSHVICDVYKHEYPWNDGQMVEYCYCCPPGHGVQMTLLEAMTKLGDEAWSYNQARIYLETIDNSPIPLLS